MALSVSSWSVGVVMVPDEVVKYGMCVVKEVNVLKRDN